MYIKVADSKQAATTVFQTANKNIISAPNKNICYKDGI